MLTQIVTVSADHVHPDYRFNERGQGFTNCKVSQNRDGTWFADHPKLGCGRDYPTADAAVRALFEAHACTAIRLIANVVSR